MLAIFHKSVASRPHTLKHPHTKSVSALQNEFLVNQFLQFYPHSVVTEVGASAVFAYSLVTRDDELRNQFGAEGDAYCIFHGGMDNLDTSVKKDFLSSGDDDEVRVIFQAFKILQEQKYQTPHHILRDLYGDFRFIFYDDSSKLLFLTNGKPTCSQLFWGLDSESSLVITDDMQVILKACAGGAQPFPKDHIYISGRGHIGLQALFGDYMAGEVEQQPLNPNSEHDCSQIIINKDTLEPQIEESWRPPPSPAIFKINTQGIVFPNEKILGIGVIIRNSSGEMILAGCKKVKGINSPALAHELASLEGLFLAIKTGFQNVIWESCSHGLEDSAYQQVLMVYEKLIGNSFESMQTSKIPWSANKAAYGLAEYAKDIDDCLVWIGEIPKCIATVIKLESSESEPQDASVPT